MPNDNVVPLKVPYEAGDKLGSICVLQESDSSILLTVKDGRWRMNICGVQNAYEVMGKLQHISDQISKLISEGRFHAG